MAEEKKEPVTDDELSKETTSDFAGLAAWEAERPFPSRQPDGTQPSPEDVG